MPKLSIVVPALNEVHNIAAVVDSVPFHTLASLGWETELVVVDNASTDGTGELALSLGAIVVLQPDRGYGHAYRAGFAVATGDVVVTADADRTYPLDHTPQLLAHFQEAELDFLSTNRLLPANRGAMSASHEVGNRVLSAVSRLLFGHRFVDSQSGMWIFRRSAWDALDVRSGGMPFSQELKNEAHVKGLVCGEIEIEYRQRGGLVKLNAFRDGVRNLTQLVTHRFRRANSETAPAPEAWSLVSGTDQGSGPRPLLPRQRADGERGGNWASTASRRRPEAPVEEIA